MLWLGNRRQRRERESPTRPPTQAGRFSPSGDQGAKAGRPAPGRQPHGMGAPGRPRMPYAKGRVASSHRAQETGPRGPDRRPSGRGSIRQWFWMGLIQDRPVAIALLSGLVLSLLAALVAGLGYLTQAS